MNIKILILFICIGFFIHGFSQEVIKSRNLTTIKESIKDIYFIPGEEEVVRLTSKPIYSNTKSGNQNTPSEMVSVSQSLIFSDGIKINLIKNETLVDLKENFLVTEQRISEVKDEKIVRNYIIKNKKITLIGQIKIGLEKNIFLLNNGNIIVTDEFELYGKSIQIYDSTLNLISSLTPFRENGYSNVSFYENQDKIIFVFTPVVSDSLGSLMLEIFDKRSEKFIKEIESERRNGYAWYGTWPKNLLEKEFPQWTKKYLTKS